METLQFLLSLRQPRLWLALGLALLPAFLFNLGFEDCMPLCEGYVRLSHWLFPFSMCNIVFHEAGHPIFGILGFEPLAVLGGSLLQWLMPLVCFMALAKNKSKAGLLVCTAWFGLSLADSAFYIADARQQVLILINGLPGNESGMHDWGYLLIRWHLDEHSFGIGRFFYFWGLYFLCLPPSLGIAFLGEKAWAWAQE